MDLILQPRLMLISACSLLLGAAAASREVRVSPGWLGLTFLAVVVFQLAFQITNRATDRTLAVATYSICFAAGLAIALLRSPMALWFAFAGFGLPWLYRWLPLRSSHRGWGDLAMGAAYGPLICIGTYLVQTGRITPRILLLAIPLGLLTGVFNMTFRRTRVGYMFESTVAAVFLALVMLPFFGLPRGVWLGVAALPFAAGAAQKMAGKPRGVTAGAAIQQMMLEGLVVFTAAVSGGLLLPVF